MNPRSMVPPLNRQEDTCRQANRHPLEPLGKLGSEPGGPDPSQCPAVRAYALLPELEDILKGDYLPLHPNYFGNVCYSAASVLKAVEMDDDLQSRGHLVPDGLYGQVQACHKDHVLYAGQGVPG